MYIYEAVKLDLPIFFIFVTKAVSVYLCRILYQADYGHYVLVSCGSTPKHPETLNSAKARRANLNDTLSRQTRTKNKNRSGF